MKYSMHWEKVRNLIQIITDSLSLVHEQSRPDRDDFVKIVFRNIVAGQKHNFEIKENVNPAGTPYDLLSTMLYAPTAFSKNGQPTIIAKGKAGSKFGNTKEPTATDLYELNVAYECTTETGTVVEEDTDYATSYFYQDYENVYADYATSWSSWSSWSSWQN